MNSSTLIFVVAFLALFSYWFAIKRAVVVAGGRSKIKKLTSLPKQFGLLTAFWCAIPSLVFLLIWAIFESSLLNALLLARLPEFVSDLNASQLSLYLNTIQLMAFSGENIPMSTDAEQLIKIQAAEYLREITTNTAWLKAGLVILLSISSVAYILSKFTVNFHSRVRIEKIITSILWTSSGIALLTTIGIVISVIFESIQFFSSVPPWEFLFGTQWSPQIAMRTDQVGGSGAFGAIPLFVGTLLISAIAMFLSVPVGLMIAIYLSQYASERLRSIAKPMLEILAGVPTVVYGFFAALTVAPLIRDFGGWLGLTVASESALAAGLVMGIMIIPFVSSLSEDAISAVPDSLKEGSLGLGATPSETIKKVLLPAALPGIVGAILLAVSRAIGETMIVVMAAGMAANLTINPLESVTTVTVQIVTLLTGDQEFDSPKTLAAFALGLMLFVTTLALNVVALKVVRKYREQYD